MALKFGSSKSEFGLRSGTANKGGLPFKQMGSTPAKGVFDIGLKVAAGLQDKPKSEFKKLSDWEATTKQENIDNEVQEVKDKTDKDITSTKKKELGWEKLQHQKDILDFQKQKHADKTSTTKTSISKEQEKEMEKTAMIRDAIESATAGKSVFTRQDAHDEKMLGLDIKTAEKTENQEELDSDDQFVDDGSYKVVSDAKSKTGSEMFGGIDDADYNTWSDEDLEKRRTDPTHKPS